MSLETETTKQLLHASTDLDLARIMWKRGDSASAVLEIVERAESSLAEVRARLLAHCGD